MKQHIYSITDPYYLTLVKLIFEKFNDNGIPPLIVGGVAVQAHLYDMLGDGAALRKTDDIDMMLFSFDRDRLFKSLHSLNGAYDYFGNLTDVIIKRNGERKPVYQYETLDKDSNVSFGEIKLNISWKEIHFYNMKSGQVNKIMNDSIKLNLAICGEDVSFIVPCLEHLIATKLVGSRDKDIRDINSLIFSALQTDTKIDFDKVMDILDNMYEGNKYTRAMSFYTDFRDLYEKNFIGDKLPTLFDHLDKKRVIKSDSHKSKVSNNFQLKL